MMFPMIIDISRHGGVAVDNMELLTEIGHRQVDKEDYNFTDYNATLWSRTHT
jgi:hypothetical protein